jgi:hypothetical protein
VNHRARRRPAAGRWVGLLAAGALAVVSSATSGTQSSWTTGAVTNPTNSAAASVLSFVHAYPSAPDTCALAGPASSTTCAGAIWSTAASSTSAATKNDTITDSSTAPAGTSMYSQGQVLSCAPVQLANAKDATNPLLPRYTVGFGVSDPWSGVSAVQLDGTQSYASAVKSEPAIPASILSLGGTAGYGAWFRTTTTAGGPILAFDTDPASAGGTRDKVLYMNATGRVGFAFDSSGTTGLSAGAFNNGAWHFAYARISIVSAAGIPISSTATLYVDGTQVASSSSLIGVSGSGYLHVGWAPISGTTYGSGLSNYFNGAVSNVVVFLGGTAPTVPGTNPASQAAFDTFAATATHQLKLGDSGTATFASSISWITGGDACAMDTLAWTLGGSNVFAATTLKSLATSGWLPTTALPAPTPGNTQASVTSYARVATGYDADVAGLHLYAPISYRAGLSSPPATGWALTFTWSGDAKAAFLG